MQCAQKILLILIAVVSDCTCHENISDTRYIREKKSHQPWYWGETTSQASRDDTSNFNLATTTTTTTEKSGPCKPFVPNKIDFSKRYRISEAKCYEYIWELKNRDDIKKHHEACNGLQRTQHRDFGINVIGGRDTKPGEFPHMGALGWRAVEGTWLFMCGSSLISSKFLLTAAHCSRVSPLDTRVADNSPQIVRLGDKNIIDNNIGKVPVDKEILQIIGHPQYNPPMKYFDIALIELKSEVTFDKFIQPACLWTKDDTSPLGTEAAVTGWGTVDAAKQETSPELQVAILDIIDSDTCKSLLDPYFFRNFLSLQSHQICAGELTGGRDSCQGDSGGPLQVKIQLPIISEGSMSYVVGVTSFGFGCGLEDVPGVYSRVSSFIDWIENIVWN